jgi:hypothetical protein
MDALKKLIAAGTFLPPFGDRGQGGSGAKGYSQAVRDHKSEFASLRSYLRCPRKVLFTQAQADEIVAVFTELLAPPLEALASVCFVTDCTDKARPVTVFNNELFCAAIAEDEAPFYQEFTQTTMFQEFIDRKMDEKSHEIAALVV